MIDLGSNLCLLWADAMKGREREVSNFVHTLGWVHNWKIYIISNVVRLIWSKIGYTGSEHVSPKVARYSDNAIEIFIKFKWGKCGKR